MTPHCVLCARPLQSGHCCTPCRNRLDRQLRALPQLATDAAAYIAPTGHTGTGSRGAAFTSRPPINLDAAEPHLALVPFDVPIDQRIPLVDLLEGWEQLIREQLGYADLATAKALRARAHHDHATTDPATDAEAHRTQPDQAFANHDHARITPPRPPATLTGVTEFLRSQLDHITTSPDFGLQLFADDLNACHTALRRWDGTRDRAKTWLIDCPADIDGTTCAWPLRLTGDDVDHHVYCRGCGTDWTIERLLLVAADTPDAHIWLDADAVTKRYRVTRRVLEQWVRAGKITREHGLYDVLPLARQTRRHGA